MNTTLRLTGILCALTAMAVTGCGNGTPMGTGDMSQMDDMMSSDDMGTDDMGTDDMDGMSQPTSGWSRTSGPCEGTRTNALWFDDRDNGFLGCGENAKGFNLYVTSNGGGTWDAERFFDETRVIDIRRGFDGVLYGAGQDQLDGFSAWRVDETGASLRLEGLFDVIPNINFVMFGENVAVTEDGQIMVDSLTGVNAGYSEDGVDFVFPGTLSDRDEPGFSVKRIKGFGNRFYAVGSLINDPARVHLPTQEADVDSFLFTTVILQQSTRSGELQDFNIWSDGDFLAVGADRSTQEPLAYFGRGNLYELDNWTQIDFFSQGIEFDGDINRLSVVGETVVVVGGKIPNSQGGFVLQSNDRGLTWTDITPVAGDNDTVGVLSNVWLFDNGDIIAYGGATEAWVFDAN